MSTSIADLPPHIQRQVREKLEAEDARRQKPPLCVFCYGTGIVPRFDGGDTRCPQCSKPKRKSKYGNTRTPFKSVQGFTVMADSKLEAKMFKQLDALMVAGNVAWWIPHPRFPLPGGVVYEADALVVERGIAPGVRVYDAKGVDRQDGRNKRKQVKDLFGIDVELVRK